MIGQVDVKNKGYIGIIILIFDRFSGFFKSCCNL